MTFDPKEARTLVDHFKNDQPVTQDMQSTMMAEEMQLAADALAAALDEIDRLREVLEKIATTGRCEFAVVRAALRNTEAPQ